MDQATITIAVEDILKLLSGQAVDVNIPVSAGAVKIAGKAFAISGNITAHIQPA